MRVNGGLTQAERSAAEMARRRKVSVGIWRKGDDYYVAPGRSFPRGAECVDEIGPAQAARILEMM